MRDSSEGGADYWEPNSTPVEGGEEVDKITGEVDKEEGTCADSGALTYLAVGAGSNSLLGQIVNSEEEAYALYCDYGHRKGFSVRKGKHYYATGTMRFRTKEYYCSKEGKKRTAPASADPNSVKLHTRTGCEAMIRFTIDDNGKWKVTAFKDVHNHEFAAPEDRHMLRSARSVTRAKAGGVLETMVSAGIRTVDALRYMHIEVAGAEHSGFARKYVNMEKMTRIEAGDSQSLVNHFKHKLNQDGMFYWDVQVDQDGRMTNFYWRDGRSRVDYDCFGDVVVFDSTYRTSIYNLLCTPFVGVNHHWQNVIYGCAFLLDETDASFEWLFSTFLDSVGGRAPKTIFTDQEEAITKAISKVFPNAHHRICLWNISKNASLHLDGLNVKKEFDRLFQKCLLGCESEKEFEETWTQMISDYDLKGHKWLRNLHNIRHKWCGALSGDIFDGGINSSQRTESTNNILNGIADKSTSLTKFVTGFDNLLMGLRRNEADEDFRCHQGAPKLAIGHSNFLKQASKAYTLKIYKLFEREYLDGVGGGHFEEIPCGGTMFRYNFREQGNDSRVRVVDIDISTMEVRCSCKKFETVGILCSHALAAFYQKNATSLPDRYILKRWTKGAKRRVYSYMESELCTRDSKESELVFRNQAMRFAYDLITMSQGQEKTREILWDILDDGEKKIREYFKKHGLDAHSMVEGERPNNEDNVVDGNGPERPRVKSKGGPNPRLKKRVKTREKNPLKGNKKSTKVQKRSKKSEMPTANVDAAVLTLAAPPLNAPSIPFPPFAAPSIASPTPAGPSSYSGFPNHPLYPTNVYIPHPRHPLHNIASTALLQTVNLSTNLSQESSNYSWRPESSSYWRPPL